MNVDTTKWAADWGAAIDWEARELAFLMVASSCATGSKLSTLAEWWNDRTKQPRKWWTDRFAYRMDFDKQFPRSNVGKAMAKVGIEPTFENYRCLVNAARKRHMPRSTPI